MADKYQIIFLHLSDDRQLQAVVPEFCKEGDRLFLHPQFEVTEPRELPEDCRWSTLPTAPANERISAELTTITIGEVDDAGEDNN